MLKIRRYIVHDIRNAGDEDDESVSQRSPRPRAASAKKLTYQAMVKNTIVCCAKQKENRKLTLAIKI